MMKYVLLGVAILVVFSSAGAQKTRQTGGATARTACNPENCVCHGQFGCFRKRTHCLEKNAPLPASPQSIGTNFMLYKRGNRGIQKLSLNMPGTAIYAAGFDSRRPTMICIHGWTQSVNAFDGLKNMLLKKEDYNVILVDWEKGAGITGRWPLAYTQPVQNTRVVGKHVAMLISHLQAVTGINPNSVHLIGASLGAQAAGYAGMYLNGTVGRISGLDPAKPNFEGQPSDCKLDRTDAQFVDVIHTNMDVAGVAESVGHVDFFPNGGRTQPGCSTSICSHLRAKSYFRSSVWTDCQFRTQRCDGTPCGPRGCPTMGFSAFSPQHRLQRGEYCLTTTGRPPYCIDSKETPKPGQPSQPNPKPPSRRPLPPTSGNPNIGQGNGKTTWFNQGKPMQPGVQPGWTNTGHTGNNPGVKSANRGSAGANAGNANGLFRDVGNGARHQTTLHTAWVLVLTLVMARLL